MLNKMVYLYEIFKTVQYPFPIKITVILSSHILSEVQLIADDIGIIANGTLGYEGEMQHSGNLEELFLKVVEESRR